MLKTAVVDNIEYYLLNDSELTPKLEAEIREGCEQSQWAWNHMINATEERVREETEMRVREEERKKSDEEKAEILQQVEAREIAIVKKMIDNDFSVEMIEQYTGLSMARIKQLLSKS